MLGGDKRTGKDLSENSKGAIILATFPTAQSQYHILQDRRVPGNKIHGIFHLTHK